MCIQIKQNVNSDINKDLQNADTFAFLQILPSTDPTKVFHTKNWLDLSFLLFCRTRKVTPKYEQTQPFT